MLAIFIECVLQGFSVFLGLLRHGRSAVPVLCVGNFVAVRVHPGVGPCLGYFMCMGTALRILLQVLGVKLGLRCSLCTVLKSEDRAGLHVSFPEGMVSYRLW